MHIILFCSLYIPYTTSWEKLLTHEDILSMVIASFILLTCRFDQVVIL